MGSLAGSSLGAEQLSSPLSSAGCQIFKLSRQNSSPIRTGQTSPVCRWRLEWKSGSWCESEECGPVSVARNQSSAGRVWREFGLFGLFVGKRERSHQPRCFTPLEINSVQRERRGGGRFHERNSKRRLLCAIQKPDTVSMLLQYK